MELEDYYLKRVLGCHGEGVVIGVKEDGTLLVEYKDFKKMKKGYDILHKGGGNVYVKGEAGKEDNCWFENVWDITLLELEYSIY